MLELIHGQTSLRSSDAQAQLDELRADSLRLFLGLVTVGYLAWQHLYLYSDPTDQQLVRSLMIGVVTGPVLIGSFILLRQNQDAAMALFVGGSLLAITWTLYVVDSPRGAMLYAILALVAAFLSHPLGGLFVNGAGIALLWLLGVVHPELADINSLLLVAVFGTLAVVGVWALTHHLFLALNWYAESFATAERHAREAQEHRAQLAQAWKQLDTAYYHLERLNAALHFAWQAAERAERSKAELAANISHELRTPLNLIVGFTEMMVTSPASYQGDLLPSAYRGDLMAVYRSAQHLLALTDDILDLAQTDVASFGLVREPVDLSQVIRDAVKMVTEYIEAKGVALAIETPETPVVALVDRTRVRQVLLNLLTNAARFTEHGTISVQLVQREVDALVRVVDSGPGIPPSDLERVFQPFVTRGKLDTDGHFGTGLGLPISKRFIELHGGEMGVESTLGVGSAFWFTLPTLAAQSPSTGHARTSPTWRYATHPERVVVIANSHPQVLRLLRRHLTGYKVEAVNTLMEGAARGVELQAAAIITDLDAGPEPQGNVLPIIWCPLRRSGLAAEHPGVTDYLVKPVSHKALLTALKNQGDGIRSILIVDDDAPFTWLVSRMLAASNSEYQIRVAHSGEEGLALARAQAPDLILLDLAMPGMDGAAVLRELAADENLHAVKVVVISAHGEHEGKLSLGTEARVVKPEGFGAGELIRWIDATVRCLASVQPYVAGRGPRR